MTFHLVDTEINTDALSQGLLAATPKASQAGAIATFEGRVRDFNEGKSVTALAYEAYPELAVSEGEKVLQEAKEKFALIDAVCVHRTGQLNIGDVAVSVVCAAPHRQEAFAACRYIIDEVKARVPIWKHEVYADGTISWVNCANHHSHGEHPSSSHTSESELTEQAYYARQSLIPLIGSEGQRRLKQKSVLVIGAGGLGSPALLYLAGAGVGTIGICEFDSLEASNLHRQILYSSQSLHQPKIEAAKDRLTNLNPFVRVNIHNQPFEQESAEQLFREYDLIVDATDSLENKLLINSKAFEFNKPLIQASVHQFEGTLSFFARNSSPASSHNTGQCTGCLWHDRIMADESFTCEQSGIIGATTGVFGSLIAIEALKFLLEIESPLRDNLLLFDLMSLQTNLIARMVNPSCIICGQAEKPDSDEIEISLKGLSEVKDFELIPAHYSKLTTGFCFNPDKKYLLYCQSGLTSREKAKTLRRSGFDNVFSLRGGLALNPAVVNFLRDDDLEPAGIGTQVVTGGDHSD